MRKRWIDNGLIAVDTTIPKIHSLIVALTATIPWLQYCPMARI
jgi:hypothetical protein